MNMPKVEKSLDVSESLQRSQKGTGTRHGCVKLEKDRSVYNVNMLAPTKALCNENINRVEKVLDLKHEVSKLTYVCFKQLEEKKKDFKTI
jgi:hypothetical protein